MKNLILMLAIVTLYIPQGSVGVKEEVYKEAKVTYCDYTSHVPHIKLTTKEGKKITFMGTWKVEE